MGQTPEHIRTAAVRLVEALQDAPSAEQALDVAAEHDDLAGGNLLAVLVSALLYAVRGEEFLETDFATPSASQPSQRTGVASARSVRAR